MTRIRIFIDFESDDLKDAIDGWQRRSRNLKPVLYKMRTELKDAWVGNFTENGLRVGGWAPLDAEYASWKSAHYPGAPPLVQTGKMFRSLRSLRGVESTIDRHSAEFSLTNIRYAKFHQYGTTKMPKRELIFEPAGFEKRWEPRIVQYIVSGKKALVGM